MAELADFGLIGLAVMGENLALNVESRGYRVAVFNRTVEKVDQFMQGRAKGKRFVGTHSLQELVQALARPRKVMLMVKAGAAVDNFIEQLIPLLSPGDVIIDGGNTHYTETQRRTKYVESKGLLYIGTGVSGGEEGALLGPSIMPGGSESAWPLVKPIFQAIAAKVGPKQDIPCCEWIGPDGAGHYVKMVHNGIEYGDMQLICEAYWLMKQTLGLPNSELYDVFEEWNRGELQSYLIEITRDIFSVHDEGSTDYLVDKILDTAGAKGTGKWMSQLALDLGVPSTLVTEAVYARCLSAIRKLACEPARDWPVHAADNMPAIASSSSSRSARRCTPPKSAATRRGSSNCRPRPRRTTGRSTTATVALLWRGGCIIRAVFLERIKEAFDADPQLENLLLAPYFQQATEKAQNAWRNVTKTAIEFGIPVPAFATALAYYDGYRSARLPANLLQAQRDYFGAHTYQRTDRQGVFHTEWTKLKRQA